MEWALKYGKINPNIQDNGKKICFMDMVNTTGLMVANMLATGQKIDYMVKEYIVGQMEEYTQDLTPTTRNQVKVYMNGLMARKQKELGSMDYNMENVISRLLLELLRQDYGKKGRELNGLKTEQKI